MGRPKPTNGEELQHRMARETKPKSGHDPTNAEQARRVALGQKK